MFGVFAIDEILRYRGSPSPLPALFATLEVMMMVEVKIIVEVKLLVEVKMMVEVLLSGVKPFTGKNLDILMHQ